MAHQSDLIKWKCCNSKLFGPNLERFTCVQIPGNGGCLALSGLALNKSPQDNHATIINRCYCFSFSPSVLSLRSALNLSLSLSVDISTGGFLILVLFTPPRHHLPLVRLNTYLRYSAPT